MCCFIPSYAELPLKIYLPKAHGRQHSSFLGQGEVAKNLNKLFILNFSGKFLFLEGIQCWKSETTHFKVICTKRILSEYSNILPILYCNSTYVSFESKDSESHVRWILGKAIYCSFLESKFCTHTHKTKMIHLWMRKTG